MIAIYLFMCLWEIAHNMILINARHNALQCNWF